MKRRQLREIIKREIYNDEELMSEISMFSAELDFRYSADENMIDEGLLDRVVDSLAGTSTKVSQMAKNFSALVLRGDKDAVVDPRQAASIRKFERNIHRIKKKFDKLIEELGEDLVSAIGKPDSGPLKGIVDDFDSAVSTFRDAIDELSVQMDKADDILPPEDEIGVAADTATGEDIDIESIARSAAGESDVSGDVEMEAPGEAEEAPTPEEEEGEEPVLYPGVEEDISESLILKKWQKIIKS